MAEIAKLNPTTTPEQEKHEGEPVQPVSTPLEPAPLKGLVGTKVGMSRVFLNETTMIPVTVILAEGLCVTQVKTAAHDGTDAVQIGYGDVAERKLTKPEAHHFIKKGLKPKRHLREFRVKDPSVFKVGQPVPVTVFSKGDWVTVSGLSKGKGFAGVVKRYGFGGLPHSHGHGEYRNRPGSSGGQGPQHVLPGTRKPGHKGHVWVSQTRIQVAEVDAEKNLILLRGSVPGPNGNLVVIRPSRKMDSANVARS